MSDIIQPMTEERRDALIEANKNLQRELCAPWGCHPDFGEPVGTVAYGHVWHINVLHDDWCGRVGGKGQ